METSILAVAACGYLWPGLNRNLLVDCSTSAREALPVLPV